MNSLYLTSWLSCSIFIVLYFPGYEEIKQSCVPSVRIPICNTILYDFIYREVIYSDITLKQFVFQRLNQIYQSESTYLLFTNAIIASFHSLLAGISDSLKLLIISTLNYCILFFSRLQLSSIFKSLNKKSTYLDLAVFNPYFLINLPAITKEIFLLPIFILSLKYYLFSNNNYFRFLMVTLISSFVRESQFFISLQLFISSIKIKNLLSFSFIFIGVFFPIILAVDIAPNIFSGLMSNSSMHNQKTAQIISLLSTIVWVPFGIFVYGIFVFILNISSTFLSVLNYDSSYFGLLWLSLYLTSYLFIYLIIKFFSKLNKNYLNVHKDLILLFIVCITISSLSGIIQLRYFIPYLPLLALLASDKKLND